MNRDVDKQILRAVMRKADDGDSMTQTPYDMVVLADYIHELHERLREARPHIDYIGQHVDLFRRIDATLAKLPEEYR
jgi:hypothetical protein